MGSGPVAATPAPLLARPESFAHEGWGAVRAAMGCSAVGGRARREWVRGTIGKGAAAGRIDEQPRRDGVDCF
jgi:hypothetical protein